MIGHSAKSHSYFYYTYPRSFKQGKEACNDRALSKEKLERLMTEQLQSRVKDWEEYAAMEKLFMKLLRTKSKLRDELAVITLRRIVPGRCKYCPI